ncbi:MAG: hypothetical protein AB8U88_04295 [Rickettsia conorii subsp. raoultii]|uniref:Uncharacterized protein n=1 Tax=Rickettsia conorii subsp. raoultii TaxID=369822 RepID=A0A9N7B0C5_RICCR|nr:hypothetical protein [Rickettsia conorii]AJQ51823.1 hypothetical protein UQ52_03420 [Rickettsia conorii subsp. raoultii]APZ30043.1 hypothetical protein RRIM16_03650 [Rickettsia conorii subsp. raoultii]URW77728.1 hypothetical protein NBT09_07060 [Rickettsia conorii subsp. raoultii]
MNDILSIIFLIPYFAISSIIPSIFILNQSAKYRRFKKALPSVIVASICYNILIHIIVFNHDFFFIFMIWYITIPLFIIGFIFLICMEYNTWNQSYFNLTIEP